MTSSLDDERTFYASIKAELLEKHEGKFALIKGKELLGVFDTQANAYAEGLRKVGNVPMLIVRIQRDEPTVWIPALQLGLLRADIQG